MAVSAISRTLQARVETQVLNTSAAVAQSDFALNASILRSVKAITGADIITYTLDGRHRGRPVEPGEAAGRTLIAAVTAPDVTRTVPAARRRHGGWSGPWIAAGHACVAHRRARHAARYVGGRCRRYSANWSAATRQLAATVLLGAAAQSGR